MTAERTGETSAVPPPLTSSSEAPKKPAESLPSIVHPRGRIAPPLDADAPLGRRIVRGMVRLVEGIYLHDDIFHMAPAMAFHFFLSLLPLLAFSGYVLGLFAQHKGVDAVLGLVLENVPKSAHAVLEGEVSQLAAANSIAPVAAIGFLWIASGGAQGLMQAIERVVGAPRRAWWKQRMLALAWVIATLVAFGIASVGIIQWEDIVNPDEAQATTASVVAPSDASGAELAPAAKVTARRDPVKRVRRVLREGGERVLAVVASLVTAIGGLAAFYRFSVAHSRRVRRRVFPGAVLAMALVIVISWGFGVYVSTLASYTVYYGSLAAIAVLLVWLWLMSVAILVGAELNSQLEGLRD